ncbi:hypothetical protein GCM10025868_46570 [Angustibacter aerolatus]|uniref:Uncharacterized protein n=1 Tax=Angustibacter aerolatus TaxID=1162965 RepID=A0ABQ6JNU4_9ACTN|nr:hypothetical protein GCM10025868_46570 [Angustibacter aerolatus]
MARVSLAAARLASGAFSSRLAVRWLSPCVWVVGRCSPSLTGRGPRPVKGASGVAARWPAATLDRPPSSRLPGLCAPARMVRRGPEGGCHGSTFEPHWSFEAAGGDRVLLGDRECAAAWDAGCRGAGITAAAAAATGQTHISVRLGDVLLYVEDWAALDTLVDVAGRAQALASEVLGARTDQFLIDQARARRAALGLGVRTERRSTSGTD